MTLTEFLDLDWSDNVRHVLRVKADRDDILALTRSTDGKAQAWTVIPPRWPSDVVAVWFKTPPGKSKTQQAVALVDEGLSTHAAAKRLGISQAAVHRAVARRRNRKTCPCCGQIIRDQAAGSTSS